MYCFRRRRAFFRLLHASTQSETACIAGESGKGKTSLLNAIMGFVPLREGTITVGDLELNKSTIDIIRRQTAWIPQELALPVEWVKEMVRLPFELKANKNNPFSKKMLFDCFAELGLDEELYNKRVGEVSGGQRQRNYDSRGRPIKKAADYSRRTHLGARFRICR